MIMHKRVMHESEGGAMERERARPRFGPSDQSNRPKPLSTSQRFTSPHTLASC